MLLVVVAICLGYAIWKSERIKPGDHNDDSIKRYMLERMEREERSHRGDVRQAGGKRPTGSRL